MQELMGNPVFADFMRYSPEKVYENCMGWMRTFDEMWTADWWWDTQKKLPPGVTIAPLILASDKTKLTSFAGNKEAWPVYLTIGNIASGVRRQTSARATILIGYIPVSKLEIFSSEEKRSRHGQQLFHECMRKILEPLQAVGREGIDTVCADGIVRHVHPLVAAYVADFPEQCLVACTKESRCPKCTVERDQRQDPCPVGSVLRDPEKHLRILDEAKGDTGYPKLERDGIRPIVPFWRDLPHCNIFACISNDLLHQLHKGLIGDHIVPLVKKAARGGAAEIDRRFAAMPQHPSLRHFKKGISIVSQATGTEYKAMERALLGVLAGIVPAKLLAAVRALLKFIHLSSLEKHNERTLLDLDSAWSAWHENKSAFIELELREHFNTPKFHSINHYVPGIRALGSNIGTNTESTERFHIDYAKFGYRKSNRRDYVEQMTRVLQRHDAVLAHSSYLDWAIPGRLDLAAAVEEGERANRSGVRGSSEEEDEDGDGDGDGPVASQQDDDGDDEDPEITSPSLTTQYTVSKTSIPQSLATISSKHNAISLDKAMSAFLQRRGISTTDVAATLPRLHLLCYKRITLHVTHDTRSGLRVVTERSAVRASASHKSARLLHPLTEPHFDTVLAYEDPPPSSQARMVPPYTGLLVARVRAIFRFQEEWTTSPHGLFAYVEWFTPLGRIDADSGLHKVSKSTRFNRPRASVIPIHHIRSGCHLFPRFGSSVGSKCSSDKSLDRYDDFYLNPDLYLRDYYLLHQHLSL
ncbi:hypothetical protein PENSPDRAFT_616234 [Peniophora sp. CONT]|nr:hypothetical protein PENSPDRAFT_618592 [Peniophora sp. CONT]KZV63713.1 hypothetical protein PENSPDRAFT_616234 [Peniophora sp. CONT]